MSGGFRIAVIAFVVVAVVSLVPIFGLFCVGPLAAAVVGAVAGYRAARMTVAGPAGAGVRAGLWAGLGALVGAVVVATLSGLFLGSLPGFQEAVQQGAQESDSTVAAEWITPALAAVGALAGIFMGVMNLAAAVVAGLVGAAIGGQRPTSGVASVE